MTNGQLVLAEGLLEQCRAWQEVVDAQASPAGRELYLPVHFPVSGIKGAMFAGRNTYRKALRFYQDTA